LQDLAGRIQPVQPRHREVENNDVGSLCLCQFYGLSTLGGFSDDLEAFALQENSAALANDVMIVSQDDSQRHARRTIRAPSPSG
jgi:hypothetical protein